MAQVRSSYEHLPILDIKGDIDRKDLYFHSILNPRGELRCRKHLSEPLVNIGRRPVEWEDGMGFDHKGWLAVKGCKICKVPALSRMW